MEYYPVGFSEEKLAGEHPGSIPRFSLREEVA
jgi:hypothetical protein